MEFSESIPCKKKAEYLVIKSTDSLKDSLIYLVDEIFKDNLINSHEINLYKKKISGIKKASFLDFLINSSVIDACEEEKPNKEFLCNFLNSIASFSQNYQVGVIDYGNSEIKEFLWRSIADVMREYLPVKTHVYPPVFNSYLKVKDLIHRALEVLEKGAPDTYDEASYLIQNIIVHKSGRVIAGSSFPILGCIYIREDSSFQKIIEFIIHEAAHQYLFHLSAFDELCKNPIGDLYKSPLRKDPRPMIGVFHAAFVLARLVYAYENLAKIPGLNEYGQITKKIRSYKNKFHGSYELIKHSADLTPLGKALIESSHSIV